MTFLIYRDSWARGGEDDTCLYSPLTLKQCVTGQVASQCRMPLAELEEVGEVGDIDQNFCDLLIDCGMFYQDEEDTIFVRFRETALPGNAQRINDNEDMTDEQREAQLAVVFGYKGHTLTFVDGVAPWLPAKAEVAA